MKIFSFFLILIVLYFIGHGLFLLSHPQEIETQVFEIGKGETAIEIANRLAENNIIRSRMLFYLYTKLTRKSKGLDYGKYLFEGKLSILDIAERIQRGKIFLKKVTIREGLSLKETFRVIAKKGFTTYRKLMKTANDSNFLDEILTIKVQSLEGFLYPETYYFPEKINPEYIIKTIVNEFYNQICDINFTKCQTLDFYEILILASIIEKEAQIDSEKPVIASVYLNRLETGMKLQADPTVAYTLEELGKNRHKIYYKDLKIESPYNTYLYQGLPPTPICSPTISSIKAVIYPEQTDYYFFFANNGRHIFSKTYRQHILKQNKILTNN